MLLHRKCTSFVLQFNFLSMNKPHYKHGIMISYLTVYLHPTNDPKSARVSIQRQHMDNTTLTRAIAKQHEARTAQNHTDFMRTTNMGYYVHI